DLLHGPAAVDLDGVAGDVARGVRHQEGGGAGQFVVLDEHTLGHRLEHDVADHLRFGDAAGAGLVGDLPGDQRGLHVGRAEGVDGDVGVGGFQGDHLGEADEAVLGGDVGALVRAGDQGVDRADVDDAAEAALAHARQHGAGEAGDADQHHLHQEVPLGDGEVFQRGDVLQAGVVDQYVDRARDRGQGGGDAVVGGDVEHQRFGRAAGVADAGGDGVGGVQVHVG